jgi:hypothetical protein
VTIVIVILAVIALVILKQRNEKKRREQFNIPKDSVVLQYLGGHGKINPGAVYVLHDAESVSFIEKRTGNRLQIPFTEILGIELNNDVQKYSVGGGRSIGGAVVGTVIAGPVGGIVGGRSKSKVKTEDRSTTLLKTKNEHGMELALIFKGGQLTYNVLTRMLS